MKKSFAILSMLIFVVSCGTRKTAYNEQRDIKLEIKESAIHESLSSLCITDSIAERLKRRLNYKITFLSPPDSTGRQYPVKIEEGGLEEEFEIERQVKSDSVSVVKTGQEYDMGLTDKSKVVVKEETESRLFRIPWWAWALVSCVIITIIVSKINPIAKFIGKMFK